MNPGRAVLVTGATGLIGAEVVDRLSPRRPVIAMTHRQPLLKRTDGSTLHSDDYGPSWSGAGIARLAADVANRGSVWPNRCSTSSGKRSGASCTPPPRSLLTRLKRNTGRVNIAGTEHAIDLAQRWNVPLVHVSTAYVCGRRNGTISEHELDSRTGIQQRIRAEQVPCRTTGDSGDRWIRSFCVPRSSPGTQATGAVRDFRNLYTLLKLTVEGRLRRLPGRYDATLSLVPVDYVADAVVAATELS